MDEVEELRRRRGLFDQISTSCVDLRPQDHLHTALYSGRTSKPAGGSEELPFKLKDRTMHARTHSSRSTTSSQRNKTRCVCGLAALLILLGVAFMLLAAGLYVNSETGEDPQVTEEYLMNLIQQVNDSPDLYWKAKFNPYGTRKEKYNYDSSFKKNTTAVQETLDRLAAFFESDTMKEHLRELSSMTDGSLPSEFDARQKWSHCASLHNVPNQGSCGSCFAFAAMGVASDRVCISSNGTIQSMFSVEDVLGCCKVCGNCYGGDPLQALLYWVNEGLVTGDRDGCRPYSADLSCGIPCSPAVYPETEYKRTCKRECQDIYFKNSYEDDKDFATMAYSMFPRTVSLTTDRSKKAKIQTVIGHFNKTADKPLTDQQMRNIIMKEIFLWGPTTMALPVTEEFLHYTTGIFSPFPATNITERTVYWHVVRLIGWGKYDGGKHYWLAVNSFGRHWGDNGVVRIDPELLERFGLEYETALP